MIPGLGRSPGKGKGYPLQYLSLWQNYSYSPSALKNTLVQVCCVPSSLRLTPSPLLGLGSDVTLSIRPSLCSAVLSHSAVSDFLGPMDCSLPGSSVHGDSPGKTTRVCCHALLQGIFPTQESNPGLPHCRRILYHLSQ